MCRYATLPVRCSYEDGPEGSSRVDPEISKTGADGGGSDPSSRSSTANSDGARDRGDQRDSGCRSCAYIHIVPTDAEYQQDNAMVQRDQLVNDVKGVYPFEASILGSAFLGSRISSGEQRQPDRRDDTGLYRRAGGRAGT